MLVYLDPVLGDEDAITDMYETYLNAGPSIREYVRDGLENPDFVGVKCVDTDTENMVGILCARPGIQFTCAHPELERVIEKRWGTQGIYTGDMLVVDPAYRGHGVASKMATELRRKMKAHGAVCMVMEQWLRSQEKDVPAMNPMRDAGDPILIAVDQTFYRDLAKYGLTCPECGMDCHCGAVVSVIDFQSPWRGEPGYGQTG